MLSVLAIRAMGALFLTGGILTAVLISRTWLSIVQRVILAAPTIYMLFAGFLLLLIPPQAAVTILIGVIPVAMLFAVGFGISNAVGVHDVSEFRRFAQDAREQGEDARAVFFEGTADTLRKHLGHLKELRQEGKETGPPVNHLAKVFGKLLDAQYRRPSGLFGRWIGRRMLDQHRPENLWTVSLLDVQPTDHVLEVGFGPGFAIAEVAQRASRGRIAGVDFSPTMVSMARRRNAAAIRAGRVDLRCADAANLPFEDASFDKAYSIHSIYFWPLPGDALRELRRVLRPGGLLILTILPKDRWPGDGAGTPDCRPYSGEDLRRMMAEAGFAETWIEIGASGAYPSNYSVLGFTPSIGT